MTRLPALLTDVDPASVEQNNRVIRDALSPLLSGSLLSADTPATNEVPVWNGTAWVYQKADLALSATQNAWTAYTPGWTAGTTNPTIGNGTIGGRYVRQGDRLITGWIRIIFGSTSTTGVGDYRFALPTAQQGGLNTTGRGQVYASAAGVYWTCSTEFVTSTAIRLMWEGGNGAVGGGGRLTAGYGTALVGWAANDQIEILFTYEASS